MPVAGSQSNLREKTTISMRPTQNSGVAYEMMARTEMKVSRQVFTRAAARSPSRIPTPTESSSVVPMSSSVGQSRSMMSSRTGMLWRNEKPRSSERMFLT